MIAAIGRITHRNRKSNLTLILFVSILISFLLVTPSSATRDSNLDKSTDKGSEPLAGSLVMDATTRQPAVGALPIDFVRSPDHLGPDGKGCHLLAVNSGFGIQFNAAGNRGHQSLAVIDLTATPAPVVVQNVYFPSPQSVNVGVVFSPVPEGDGSYPLYVSGGFEDKIWIFR